MEIEILIDFFLRNDSSSPVTFMIKYVQGKLLQPMPDLDKEAYGCSLFEKATSRRIFI